MRVTDKLALIDKVGRELQSRFTYDEIDAFLDEFKVSRPDKVSTNSKWVYSKAALTGQPLSILLQIAEELEVVGPDAAPLAPVPPRNWRDTENVRLFISHISKNKDKAVRLKDCLAPHGIAGFVAHEDIEPTLEWQSEVERALNSMDALIAILTPNFSKSVWTQQEIGFALGRRVKVISFKMGEDPTGFISKQQALSRRARTAEQIAQEIATLLSADPRTADRLRAAQAALNPKDEYDDVPF